MLVQAILLCGCGSSRLFAKGMCASCYYAHQHDLRYFGGQRYQALKRDGRRCTCCGSDRQVVVHHRKPGVNLSRLFVTLCRRCHARIHWARRAWFGMTEFLRQLWREQHPRQPQQLEFAFITTDRCNQMAQTLLCLST